MPVGDPMFEDRGVSGVGTDGFSFNHYGKYKQQEKVEPEVEKSIVCKSCDKYTLVWKFSDGPKDKPIMKLYHCQSCGNYTQISLEKGIVINDQTFFQMTRHMGKTKMIPGDQGPPTADGVYGGNDAFNTVHQEQVIRVVQAEQLQVQNELVQRLNRAVPIGAVTGLGAAGPADIHRMTITPEQITRLGRGVTENDVLSVEEEQCTDKRIINLVNMLTKEHYKRMTYLWIIGIIMSVQIVNLIFTYLAEQ